MSTYDVAVVGRGAIGSAAALAFARAGRRVALVGPQPRAAALPDAAAGAPKAAADDWDQRVYALSPASRTLLMDLGVWQMLEPARIAPVHDMRIYRQATVGGRTPPPEVHLDAYHGRVEALAWIIENRELQGALDRTIAATLSPSKLVRVDAEVDGLALPLTSDERGPASLSFAGGGRLSARLVIAADGTASRLRNFAGIDHVVRDYDQTAIVANFEAERPHRDCAWQWFGDFGVVALLPLPSDDLGHGRSRVSLVWSAPAEEGCAGAGEGVRRPGRAGAGDDRKPARRAAHDYAAGCVCPAHRPVPAGDQAVLCPDRRRGACDPSHGRAGHEPRLRGRARTDGLPDGPRGTAGTASIDDAASGTNPRSRVPGAGMAGAASLRAVAAGAGSGHAVGPGRPASGIREPAGPAGRIARRRLVDRGEVAMASASNDRACGKLTARGQAPGCKVVRKNDVRRKVMCEEFAGRSSR